MDYHVEVEKMKKIVVHVLFMLILVSLVLVIPASAVKNGRIAFVRDMIIPIPTSNW
jgi:hypothetical protein